MQTHDYSDLTLRNSGTLLSNRNQGFGQLIKLKNQFFKFFLNKFYERRIDCNFKQEWFKILSSISKTDAYLL